MPPSPFAPFGIPQPTHVILLPSKLHCQRMLSLQADEITMTWSDFWQTWLEDQGPMPRLDRVGMGLLLHHLYPFGPQDGSDEQKIVWQRSKSQWIDALWGLQDAGIDGATLCALADHNPSAKPIGQVLSCYQKALQDRECQDEPSLRRACLLALAQGQIPDQWQALERITLHAAGPLAGADLDLMEMLSRMGMSITVILPWDHERPHAFAWPGTWLEILESREHNDIQVEWSDKVGQGPLAALRQRLLDAPSEPLVAPCTLHGSVTQEAMWQQLLHHIGEAFAQGRSPADLLVVLPHAGLLQQACQVLIGAGVPVRAQYPIPLHQCPLLTCLLAGLKMGLPGDDHLQHLVPAWQLWGEPLTVGEEKLAPQAWLAWLLGLQIPIGPGVDTLLAYATARAESLGCSAEHVEAARQQVQTWRGNMAKLGEQATFLQWIDWCLQLVHQITAPLPDMPMAQDPSCQHAAPEHWSVYHRALRHWLIQIRAQAELLDLRTHWTRRQFLHWLTEQSIEQTLPWQVMQSCGVQLVLPGPLPDVAMLLCVGFAQEHVIHSTHPNVVLPDRLRRWLHGQVTGRLPLLASVASLGDSEESSQPTQHGQDVWLWLEMVAACQEQLIVLTEQAWQEEGPDPHPFIEHLGQILDGGGKMSSRMEQTMYMAPDHWLPLVQDERVIQGMSATTWQRWHDIQRRCARFHPEKSRSWPLLGQAACQWLEDRIGRKLHSVSALDGLAACKYRYFAEVGLRLKNPPTLVITSDGRTEGSLAHKALEQIYRQLSLPDNWFRLGHGDEMMLHQIPDWLLVEQQNLRAFLPLQQVMWPRIWFKLTEQVRKQVEQDSVWAAHRKPIGLEYAFGSQGHNRPPLTLRHPQYPRSLQVRGSIDRIDLETLKTPEGSAQTSLVVIDYKSNPPTRSEGRHLQLDLYAAVAARDYGLQAPTIRAAWRSLQDGREKATTLLPVQSQDVLPYVAGQVWSRLDDVLGGNIQADAIDVEVCQYCTYRRLCRQPLRQNIRSSQDNPEQQEGEEELW